MFAEPTGFPSAQGQTVVMSQVPSRHNMSAPAKALARAPKARRAPLAAPGPGLDDLKLAQLRRVFQLLDADGDGLLSDEQLRTAVEAAGIAPTWQFLALARGAEAGGASLESVRASPSPASAACDSHVQNVTNAAATVDAVFAGSGAALCQGPALHGGVCRAVCPV
jgi:hypothetical protein